jgi:hypothetical protein
MFYPNRGNSGREFAMGVDVVHFSHKKHYHYKIIIIIIIIKLWTPQDSIESQYYYITTMAQKNVDTLIHYLATTASMRSPSSMSSSLGVESP